MNPWWSAALAGAGALVLTWAVLVVSAARLPPGLLRELAGIIPHCVRTARALRGHPAVPRRAKLVVALAVVWCCSPLDLLPDFLPVIGPLDDVVVVALALRYAARQVPRGVLEQAWTGDRATLERLLGRRHRAEPDRARRGGSPGPIDESSP